MSTYSGMSGLGDITEYLMYDYNSACGFIAIAPSPITISSLVISGTETGTTAPTSISAN